MTSLMPGHGSHPLKVSRADLHLKHNLQALRRPESLGNDDYSMRQLLEITEISLGGRKHAVQTYLATRADQVKGVIHGVSGYTSQELMTCLHAGHRKILHARMMGQSNSAVITFEGVYPPRHITVHRAVTRVHPYRPRSTLCLNCLEIGHKTEVCPRKHTHRYCNVCSTPLAIDPEDEEPHKCVPHCTNCDGDHAPTDPKCPSRLQADEDLAESMQARQQRAARLRQRPNKYPPPPPLDDANYPQLQNRFSALRKSTSQDRSQSATRIFKQRSAARNAPHRCKQRQQDSHKEREESVTRPTPAKRCLLASKTSSDSSTKDRYVFRYFLYSAASTAIGDTDRMPKQKSCMRLQFFAETSSHNDSLKLTPSMRK
ncbi:hypothetical protein HPB48_009637 [Haemaphysalis longicornis]|uniref:CCHC-type domain-containing protein n=1 Tax=Haemaphysalis longicornis TaxID=44386 RepID=A0A9J6GAL5_HAELO|nr:hypothetical protein HPB48_009637 [Haemaphysalis longicornis]